MAGGEMLWRVDEGGGVCLAPGVRRGGGGERTSVSKGRDELRDVDAESDGLFRQRC